MSMGPLMQFTCREVSGWSGVVPRGGRHRWMQLSVSPRGAVLAEALQAGKCLFSDERGAAPKPLPLGGERG